ncbi:hypothetical protein EVAR_62279_1 [Eumeta japonica]|uniref:Uncharacterized protein n=1 Tax=Eumeta variegata TaxID=151549 RepID=A0A4C1YVR1_EUMVA|nr:hypothetical protein EVAR_62279_1 [Eumeta japonica]
MHEVRAFKLREWPASGAQNSMNIRGVSPDCAFVNQICGRMNSGVTPKYVALGAGCTRRPLLATPLPLHV